MQTRNLHVTIETGDTNFDQNRIEKKKGIDSKTGGYPIKHGYNGLKQRKMIRNLIY